MLIRSLLTVLMVCGFAVQGLADIRARDFLSSGPTETIVRFYSTDGINAISDPIKSCLAMSVFWERSAATSVSLYAVESTDDTFTLVEASTLLQAFTATTKGGPLTPAKPYVRFVVDAATTGAVPSTARVQCGNFAIEGNLPTGCTVTGAMVTCPADSGAITSFKVCDSILGKCTTFNAPVFQSNDNTITMIDSATDPFNTGAAENKSHCLTMTGLTAATVDYPLLSPGLGKTITGVAAHCLGGCGTPAIIRLEDGLGNAMTGSVTATTTSQTPYTAITAGGLVGTAERVQFDVTNTPTTGDVYMICAKW